MQKKPEIVYPCKWPFRVIGSDPVAIRSSVEVALKPYPFTVGSGNISRKGTYSSVHVEVLVAHEEQRNTVYAVLKGIPGVKMII